MQMITPTGNNEYEAEYLIDFLQKLLDRHYDKINDYQIQLCLFQYTGNSQKWGDLAENDEIGEAVKKLLNEKRENENLEYKKIEIGGRAKYIVYDCIQQEFGDSRIESCNYKKLYWVWLADEVKESIRLILKIFTDELKNRLTDMIYLERIWEIKYTDSGMGNEENENLKKSNTYLYFFGNLMDKDWLNRQYVKNALCEHELPEWKVFLQISAMFYEQRTISTSLFFLNKDENLPESYILQFDREKRKEQIGSLGNSNLRTIRKLMELSGPNRGLVIRKPNYSIEGVVNETPEMQSKIQIEFEGRLVWRMKKETEIIFEYRDGEYKLPELERKDDSNSELEKLDALEYGKEEIERIKDIVREIKKISKHGTSIIFMDAETHKTEVERLGKYNRAYQIEEFELLELSDNLPGILDIDGALMAGIDCKCRAVGVIVDGKVKIKGRTDRGARYNSLVNYVHKVKKREIKRGREDVFCCAVIISEDKMIHVEIP